MANPSSSDELNYDDFVLEPWTTVTENATIASGYVLEARTVMGKKTSGDQLAPLDEGASDGTETPYAILVSAVDTSGGAAVRSVYKAGSFNQNKLVFYDTGSSSDDIKDAFRLKGIFLLDSVSKNVPDYTP